MPKVKAFLWRVVYVVLVVVILLIVVPLLLDLLGIGLPHGPALQLLQICLGLLALIYIFFGPEPPYAPF